MSSLGGEGGAPHMEEDGVIEVPSKGENSRYFQVSELEKGSDDSALLTKPRFSCVSEVEFNLCMGDLGAGAAGLVASSRGGVRIPKG